MRLIGGYSEKAKEYPLHDYQCAGVNFILERLFTQDEKGAGIFLDPGLGKTRTTLTALDFLFKLGAVERALVVAPLRPMYTVWPAEIREWGFPQSHIILHKQHEKAMAWRRQIELVNFEGLKKLADIQNRWDVIVVDESTFCKNWSTKTVGYMKKIIKTVPKRLILTGTPAANSLVDLFSQMYIVDDGESLGATITRFRANFCTAGGWQGRKWSVNAGQAKVLHKVIEDRVLRMKAEDYLDMPDLLQHNMVVELPDAARRTYKRFEKELIAELENLPDEKATVYATNAASAYSKCRQLASGPVYMVDEDGRRQPVKGTKHAKHIYKVLHDQKLRAMDELLEGLNGKPLLSFYNFKHEIEELSKRFKTDVAVIHGGMKTDDLMKVVEKWNNDEYRILFCQWRAASHGLNLQKGSCADIACYSLTDSPETYEQAYRRIYRQGVKSKQVRIHRIIARDTVEEVQLERLEGKFETQREFLAALQSQARRHLKKVQNGNSEVAK